jgi:hypothetical protein
MSVDVIETVLRIVFGHEDRGFAPVTAFRDCFDDRPSARSLSATGRAWRRKARTGALGVIVVQQDQHQVRQVAVFLELRETPSENVGPVLIGTRLSAAGYFG